MRGVSQSLRKITKITTQKRATNRYNIYLDDVYAFSVDEDTLIKEQLHKGRMLTEADIQKVSETDNIQQTYLLAINYLSYRMRSMKELYTYLLNKDVAEEKVNMIMQRLIEENLINDEQFANAFVKDRILLTSKGPQVIIKELQEKGISPSIAKKAVKQFSYEEQFKKALAFAEREQKKRSKHAYRKREEQLRYKLLQRGFTNDVVMAVMNEVKGVVDKDEERIKLEKQGTKLFERHRKKYEGYELKERIKAGLYQRGFTGDLINEFVAKIDESM